MVLKCNATESNSMIWLYNGMEIIGSNSVGVSRDVEAFGFILSVELISKSFQESTSTLSFSANAAMNGDNVSCKTISEASNNTSSQVTQVIQIVGKTKLPRECMVAIIYVYIEL